MIGYLRRSTAKQSEDSLDTQIDKISRWCESRGIIAPTRWIREPNPISARVVPLAKRPGGRELLAAIDAGEKEIVVSELSRLFRNVEEGYPTILAWGRRGIHIHCAFGVTVDCDTAMGRGILSFMLATTELEAALAGERVADSHQLKQQNGKRVSRHPRIGYEFDPHGAKNPKTGKLKDERPCAPEIKLIGFVRSLHAQDMTLAEIAEVLNRQNARPQAARLDKKGQYHWYPSNVRRFLLAEVNGHAEEKNV